jgi:hypothetical protein
VARSVANRVPLARREGARVVPPARANTVDEFVLATETLRWVGPLPSQCRSPWGRCYEALVPGMVPSGILVADNAINH